MTLWHLTSKDWGYDCIQGVVIRASSARRARRMVAAEAKDEGPKVWLSPEHSTCARLWEDGEPGIIIRDFNAG